MKDSSGDVGRRQITLRIFTGNYRKVPKGWLWLIQSDLYFKYHPEGCAEIGWGWGQRGPASHYTETAQRTEVTGQAKVSGGGRVTVPPAATPRSG